MKRKLLFIYLSFIISGLLYICFSTLSKANDYCGIGNVIYGDLHHIVDNIYLSSNGILYERFPCQVSEDDPPSGFESESVIVTPRSRWGDHNEPPPPLSNDEPPAIFTPRLPFGFGLPSGEASFDPDPISSWGDDNEASPSSNEPSSPNNKPSPSLSPSNIKKEIDYPNNPIEIAPVYDFNFIELERKITIKELLLVKKLLLQETNSKLIAKYGSQYVLLENNNLILRAKVQHMNREITKNTWETLELTITPILSSPKKIDLTVSAILYVQSGLKFSVPHSSSYYPSESDDHILLEEYIRKLITYLKNSTKYTNFSIKVIN